MTTKGDKTRQGWVVKDAIQQMLLKTPMRFNEIMLQFDLEPTTIKNYIASLKMQSLIRHHPDDMSKHISFRRYIAIAGMPTFSDVIKKSLCARKEGAAAARVKRAEIYNKFKEKDYVTIVSIDDYHTTGTREKQCSWVGSTLGTMDY